MRSLLFFLALIVIYYALKAVFRSASQAYRDGRSDGPARLKGEEMVLDPECRTYVIRERATTRRIQGKLLSFCSEACARRYEEKHRG